MLRVHKETAMLSMIIDELNEAVGCLWEDDWAYAYHTGKAGGIAFAVGARSPFEGLLFDDISDAYERLDLAAGYSEDFGGFDPEEFGDLTDYIVNREGAFWEIIVALKELPEDNPSLDEAAAAPIRWEEYGVALNEAIQAQVDGDGLRYALMIGFVSGLMFRDPGPESPEGSILNAIEEGYQQDRAERLQWAQSRLAGAHRHSDPSPFVGKEEYDRYMKEKLQTMRRVQNFGLYGTRAGGRNRSSPLLYVAEPGTPGPGIAGWQRKGAP